MIPTDYYRQILSLLRVLEDGRLRCEEVDEIIEETGQIYNLRIKSEKLRFIFLTSLSHFSFRETYNNSRSEEDANFRMHRLVTFVDRYFHLIAFNSYLSYCAKNRQKSVNSDLKVKSFGEWLKERPEIGKLIEELYEYPEQMYNSYISSC